MSVYSFHVIQQPRVTAFSSELRGPKHRPCLRWENHSLTSCVFESLWLTRTQISYALATALILQLC